jgi:hypothetical protein
MCANWSNCFNFLGQHMLLPCFWFIVLHPCISWSENGHLQWAQYPVQKTWFQVPTTLKVSLWQTLICKVQRLIRPAVILDNLFHHFLHRHHWLVRIINVRYEWHWTPVPTAESVKHKWLCTHSRTVRYCVSSVQDATRQSTWTGHKTFRPKPNETHWRPQVLVYSNGH